MHNLTCILSFHFLTKLTDLHHCARFKQLGVIADGQVAGDFAVDTSQAFKDMLAMVGPRGQNFVPIRSIKEAGGHVTLSSDWDVSDLNPFIGLLIFNA